MRSLRALCSIVAVVMLAMPGTALAGAPVDGSSQRLFIDPDFCGSGLPVMVGVDNAFTAHERVAHGILYFATDYSGITTYTYQPSGRSAIVKYAAQTKDQTIVDNGDGIITIRQAVTGLTERLTLPDGTVAYSDRGRQVFEFVIDTNGTPLDDSDDTLVGDDGVVFAAGPHPLVDSGDTLFCDLLPTALGMP